MSDNDAPRWQMRLEAVAPLGCVVMAALAIMIGAYAWAIDYFAGHLQ